MFDDQTAFYGSNRVQTIAGHLPSEERVGEGKGKGSL